MAQVPKRVQKCHLVAPVMDKERLEKTETASWVALLPLGNVPPVEELEKSQKTVVVIVQALVSLARKKRYQSRYRLEFKTVRLFA